MMGLMESLLPHLQRVGLLMKSKYKRVQITQHKSKLKLKAVQL